MRQLRRMCTPRREAAVCVADQGAMITVRFLDPLIPQEPSPVSLDIEPGGGTTPEHASLGTSGIGEPGGDGSLGTDHG